MKTLFLILGVLMAACAGDGAGEGGDTLPKKGESASDPTIVSATARCTGGGIIVDGTPPEPPKYMEVNVAASDPMGEMNLSTATVSVNGMTDIDNYGGEGGASKSYNTLTMACMPGTTYVIDITVANKTGGVTTASVDVVTN